MTGLVDHLLALPGWMALLLVFLLLALEASAFVGLLVPGELAVLAGGVLAFQHRASLAAVLAVAVAGAVVGFAIGRRAGAGLYRRPDGRLVTRARLERAQGFYQRRGASTIVLARFVPVVRTLAPLVAGAAGMRYRRFVAANVLGGLLWGVGVSLAGFLLGRTIPSIDRYLLPVIALIVALSLLPPLVEAVKARRSRSPRRDQPVRR